MSSKDKVRLFSELSPSEQIEILRGPERDKAQFNKRLKEIRRRWLKRLEEINKEFIKR